MFDFLIDLFSGVKPWSVYHHCLIDEYDKIDSDVRITV